MKELENLYAFELKKIPFIERKTLIEDENTLITGPAKSGKTFVLFNYILQNKKKKYLYIDLKDLRVDKFSLNAIETFINTNGISMLAIDNWDGVDYAQNLNIQKIYISKKYHSINNFKHVYLNTLDFEEYMLFESNPSSSITHTFNNYMKFGTIPHITQSTPELKYLNIQNMLNEIFDSETKKEIFIFALKYIGYAFSLHQIFQILKKRIKLSKDKFYLYINELIEESMIFLIPKFNQPNAPKKIYAYDFALRDGVTFEKKFTSIYENMILKELLKLEKEIFYFALIDFYIPDESLAIMAMPFASKDSIKNTLSQISLEIGIKKIEIITMGFEDDYMYNGIQVEVIPYWTWALKDEK